MDNVRVMFGRDTNQAANPLAQMQTESAAVVRNPERIKIKGAKCAFFSFAFKTSKQALAPAISVALLCYRANHYYAIW